MSMKRLAILTSCHFEEINGSNCSILINGVDFTISRIIGTLIPKKQSFSPYSLGFVLKNFERISAWFLFCLLSN